jgi:hypothetical protein
MAMEAKDLAEAGQQGCHLAAVRGPLLPGPIDEVQGGVGEEDEGRFVVHLGKLPGQAVAAGLPHPEERFPGARTPGGVQAYDLEDSLLVAISGFTQDPGKPGFPKEAGPGGGPVRQAVALAPEH